jgi:hypothetical protein
MAQNELKNTSFDPWDDGDRSKMLRHVAVADETWDIALANALGLVPSTDLVRLKDDKSEAASNAG